MESRDYKPSRFAWWILERLNVYSQRYFIKEDLEEEYLNLCQTQGKRKARRWLRRQTLLAVGFYLKYLFSWRNLMLKNYLKITIRNIKRHKAFSFINISGLAIGMACCILIILYIRYELSYDKFHENAEDIYRIIYNVPGNSYQGSDMFSGTPGPLAPALIEEFPEVLNAARIIHREAVVRYKINSFTERRFLFADPALLDIFNFPLVMGDADAALKEPFSVLISQETAKKYFAHENPIGKQLNIHLEFDKNEYCFLVSGVLKNIPDNSHLKFDILGSFQTLRSVKWFDYNRSWTAVGFRTYVQLRKDSSPININEKLVSLIKKHRGENTRARFLLQPLTSIHLQGNLNFEIENNSDIRYIYLFSAIAFFIMLIACFNYMNLSSARSTDRSKEIGLRKVVGAHRQHLISQFIGESIIFALFSFLVSLILVRLTLPFFNSFVERDLHLSFNKNFEIILGCIGLTIISGLISGSYPAFLLSSFKPINIIRGNLKINSKGSSIFRSSLVVIQFSISIILIACTLIFYKQLIYINNNELGFTKEHIVTVYLRDDNLKENYSILKNNLILNPKILDISVTRDLPITMDFRSSCTWEGKTEDDYLNLNCGWVDYNFIDFFDIELKSGRDFSEGFSSDETHAYILNETAVKALGWENPIGKKFGLWDDINGTVIGVVKDFHYSSLHLSIEPLVISLNQLDSRWFKPSYFAIKITSDDVSETLAFIEQKFKEFSPYYPFEYSFLDERIDRMYSTERKLGQAFNFFTFIAIFIACLGLFGLASFSTVQKTKEIGIRKVLGASVSDVFLMVTKEFIKWVAISIVIAFPISYYAMNKWLQGFAYRTNLGIGIFFLAGLSALVIALVSVSYQSIKAATANPVDSLRYE